MKSAALQHAKEGLEELDTEKILSAYAEGFVFEDVPSGESISDRAQLRAYFEALFALPQVAFSEVKVYESENFAAVEWTWSSTKRSSGQAYRVKGASIIELRDGSIARESLYYDPRGPLS